MKKISKKELLGLSKDICKAEALCGKVGKRYAELTGKDLPYNDFGEILWHVIKKDVAEKIGFIEMGMVG